MFNRIREAIHNGLRRLTGRSTKKEVTSHGHRLVTRRYSLNRRQRRARVVLARTPKILRFARTSNGYSCGRLSA